MKKILHILVNHTPLGAEIIRLHQQDKEVVVWVEDLAAGPPDYHAVVKKIFEADSIQVW